MSAVVSPILETEPVYGRGDAADDIAIWIHPYDVERSKVIATDKKKGLIVYSLEGTIVSNYLGERYNNVDIRYHFLYQGNIIDLISASNKDTGAVDFFYLEDDSRLIKLNSSILGNVNAYGVCLFHERQSHSYYVVLTGTEKGAELYKIWSTDKGLKFNFIREFDVRSRSEGCVVDDIKGKLYLAEEEKGIWKYDLMKPNQPKILVDSIKKNNRLSADIEGLTLFYTNQNEGYLLASSQGNNRFIVYDRHTNRYIFDFEIKGNRSIDAVSHTDGIDITNLAISAKFPFGAFIVQDDRNRDHGKKRKQNFKFVSWQDIVKASEFDIDLRSTWNPRS